MALLRGGRRGRAVKGTALVPVRPRPGIRLPRLTAAKRSLAGAVAVAAPSSQPLHQLQRQNCQPWHAGRPRHDSREQPPRSRIVGVNRIVEQINRSGAVVPRLMMNLTSCSATA